MIKEDKLRNAIKAVGDIIKNTDDITKLINDKYIELIRKAINNASNHIEKTKSVNHFSHTLKVLFDKSESKEGLNK